MRLGVADQVGYFMISEQSISKDLSRWKSKKKLAEREICDSRKYSRSAMAPDEADICSRWLSRRGMVRVKD